MNKNGVLCFTVMPLPPQPPPDVVAMPSPLLPWFHYSSLQQHIGSATIIIIINVNNNNNDDDDDDDDNNNNNTLFNACTCVLLSLKSCTRFHVTL